MPRTLSLWFAVILFVIAGLQDVQANEKTILVLGDSLTAGYGLPPGQAFPDQLGKALDRKSTRLNSSHIQKSRMPSSA